MAHTAQSKYSHQSQSLQPQILVLDFGSQYTQLIARRLREMGVYTEIMPYFESLESISAKAPKGIILSGGPASVYAKDAFKPDSRIFELGIPILGICYGMQFIAHFFGGRVAKSSAQEFGNATLRITQKSAIFKGVSAESSVWMSHADKVETLPKGFIALASSENTPHCAISNEAREIYALQFHPEVAHSECGSQILANFALEICKAQNNWNMANFIELEIERVREIVGLNRTLENLEMRKSTHPKKPRGRGILEEKSGLCETSNADRISNSSRQRGEALRDFYLKDKPSKILCAVSGGVDSSVVATLLYRAVGDNLIPVFVDSGLLRAGERAAVEKMFKEHLKVPLITIDASKIFLSRLKGVTSPEKKRKIIGKAFIDVFSDFAKRYNKGDIKFLAQGTLYPDVIESVSIKGPSKTIKSHHNVGGLPKKLNFKLIEPLRELFKDEVRMLGRELGMPQDMIARHPFPGPGLAIRILGAVNSKDLALLRKCDVIFIEELKKAGLYDSVWQGFCVLLNVKSVGVMGDNRTYDNTIAIRAVEATDGMTARFSRLPLEFLEIVANRIINEVKGINRVVYDITSKPPGTIEWE